MLKVYAWKVCPHCHRTIEWLNAHGIPFEYLEIEEQPPEVVQKVVEVNGGDDWVVPTLEYNGKWRPGKVFNAAELEADLRAWGIIPAKCPRENRATGGGSELRKWLRNGRIHESVGVDAVRRAEKRRGHLS